MGSRTRTAQQVRRSEIAKTAEERRLLDGFLHRLALKPTRIEESESPDFFLDFVETTVPARIGCEVVRFDGETEGASRIEHGRRWKVFAQHLHGELQRQSLPLCGSVFARGDSIEAFNLLVRQWEDSSRQICCALRRTAVTDGDKGLPLPRYAIHVGSAVAKSEIEVVLIESKTTHLHTQRE